MTTVTASTMVELKQRIRVAMGWPDRRSWTAAERTLVRRCWTITVDWRAGQIVATKRHPEASR